MDPLSISAAAAGLIPLCWEAAKIIKDLIERVKNAAKELLNFLSRTERMRLLLEQLRGLTRQLGARDNTLVIAFSDVECTRTIQELRDVVFDIARSSTTAVVRFQYLFRHGKLVALSDKLDKHRNEIEGIMLSVSM